MTAINPFDAADLTNYIESNHILNWYARLSPALKQRCVDSIIDTTSVIEFIGQATQHLEHSPNDFDKEALNDLAMRILEKIRR